MLIARQCEQHAAEVNRLHVQENSLQKKVRSVRSMHAVIACGHVQILVPSDTAHISVS